MPELRGRSGREPTAGPVRERGIPPKVPTLGELCAYPPSGRQVGLINHALADRLGSKAR